MVIRTDIPWKRLLAVISLFSVGSFLGTYAYFTLFRLSGWFGQIFSQEKMLFSESVFASHGSNMIFVPLGILLWAKKWKILPERMFGLFLSAIYTAEIGYIAFVFEINHIFTDIIALIIPGVMLFLSYMESNEKLNNYMNMI